MHRYYVNRNAQLNGDHEVHKAGCTFIPLEHNRLHLGTFASCRDAIQESKKHYSKSNGCFYCSNDCHTS